MLTRARRAFQRELRARGIELRKAPPNHAPLPVFRLALQALMAARGDALRFVQVGANDGEYVDPLRPFVLSRGWRGVLVEPQPALFEKLKANYAACADRLTFESLAISPHDKLVLFLPPETYTSSNPDVRPDSMVSTNAEVLARQIGVAPATLQRIEVPAITLDALFAKHDIAALDLLQIDAEGYDWEILKTLSLGKVAPTLIQMETGHLTRRDLAELADHLESAGYGFYYGGNQGDAVALRNDFVIDD